MRQPWPSPNEVETREPPRVKLTQTLHNRPYRKFNAKIFQRTDDLLKCHLSTLRIKEKFISLESSFIFDDEQLSFLSRFHPSKFVSLSFEKLIRKSIETRSISENHLFTNR